MPRVRARVPATTMDGVVSTQSMTRAPTTSVRFAAMPGDGVVWC